MAAPPAQSRCDGVGGRVPPDPARVHGRRTAVGALRGAPRAQRPEHLGLRPRGRAQDPGRRPRRDADRAGTARPYLLGADPNGRDLFVRVLYGGRTSLLVGIASAILCVALGVVLALVAGTLGGTADALISRLLDVIWSFPVYLLAVALAATLEVGGLEIGPLHVSSTSIWIPIVIIAVVFVPYVARPIRGQVLSLRRQEFVEAAVAHGAGSLRVMASELLPNVMSSALIFFTLIVANNILIEAALSFLGVGVPLLTPSWGNIIEQGYAQIVTSPAQTVVPGIAILLTRRVAERPRRRTARRARPARRHEDPRLTRFVLKRIAGMLGVLVRRVGPGLPDLQRDPGRRSRAADGGPPPDAGEHHPDPPEMGLRPPVLGAVRRHARPSLHQARHDQLPGSDARAADDPARHPADALARRRRRDHLDDVRDRHRGHLGRAAGQIRRQSPDDPRARRHLDADLLARRRAALPAHVPLARLTTVQLDPGGRVRAVRREPAAVGGASRPALDRARGGLDRLLRARRARLADRDEVGRLRAHGARDGTSSGACSPVTCCGRR